MANRYRKTYERILARIVGGRLAHADETEVDLQKDKGYDAYCRRGRKKNPPPTLEVYPGSFWRTHLNRKEAQTAEGATP